MIVALWRKQVLTYEILPKGQTVDNVVYLNFLERRVLPEVHRKKFGRPIILHDNARPHKHRLVREFLQEHRWEELEHPSYNPDMSPPDMEGIARIKGPNKGKQFQFYIGSGTIDRTTKDGQSKDRTPKGRKAKRSKRQKIER
jgi:hypothetical protein